MKIILIGFLFMISVSLSAQDYKKADEFESKIESSFINNIRFSKETYFYLKTDSNKYIYPINSEYVESGNEFHLLNSTFKINDLKIDLKRINKNYWYYSESKDSSQSIKGFFSIDYSNYYIPINNYTFEVIPFNWNENDTTIYFDTLYSPTKEGSWTEIYDNFYYSGNYVKNLKDSDWDLFNEKYSSILLNTKTYKNNSIINSSEFKNKKILNQRYFYGMWEIKSHLNNKHPYLLFKKNGKKSVYIDKEFYHYNNHCGNSPKPIDYKWTFNKKEMTLTLDDKIYKIIYNNKNEFILVEIKKD